MLKKNMIAKIGAAAVVIMVCLCGCSKSGSSDKLTLKFKSVSSFNVTQGQSLSIAVECSDVSKLSTKATDTAIGIQFTLMNATSSCSISGGVKTRITSYPVPDLTGATSNNSTINFNFSGSSSTSIPGTKCRPIDSTQVKIWVKSQAGIVSDTLILPSYIIIKNQ
jgi:hypothetical protein